MTRKPVFWIVLTLLGLGGGALALRLFPTAFPLLSVQIQMDRESALAKASTLADRFQWAPEDRRQAASFGHLDPAFQTYMELEGGGLEKLNGLVRDEVLTLYAWRVRHFAPGRVEEAEVQFTPGGEAYGFDLLLSEEAGGNNLPQDSARAMAMDEAVSEWGVDPDLLQILESSAEEQPGGRIDHTFVYRRTGLAIGEAEVRLRLRVAGDRLAEVTPFFHVPEAFLRRYQDTRSANETISLLGTVVFVLLFLILAGGVGTMHLLKRRWIEWKAPLAWGALVAGLMALGTVNSLPLAWMGYDTALAPQVFVATIVAAAVGLFLAGTVFLGFAFMAGESLLRRGFPDQIQQWKLWAPGVVNSTPVLGRTAAPYLILGLKLGYVVAFYMVMTRLAGWWSPAGSLMEPDLLATHFPWLTAVSTSLFAAFSEESIFRAIPLGAAAILGRRYGKRGAWIWGAILLQALVFAASHANYPQQPPYARVAEIFPIYVAWGVICVHFGLVPAIIGHFTYDLALFSLPLFTAEAPGLWGDRLVVVAAGLLPLGIVLWARWRRGGVNHVPEWALNRSWKPSVRGPEAPEEAKENAATLEGDSAVPPKPGQGPAPVSPSQREGPQSSLSGLGKALVAGIGLTGLLLWAMGLSPGAVPRLNQSLPGAEAEAREALAAQGVQLDEGWVPLFSVASGRGLAHRFAWVNGTPEEYQELVGSFLHSPSWRVRFVRFGVPPEDRAESFTVTLPAFGRPPGASHILPEGEPGEMLAEEEARTLAVEALQTRLAVDPERVRELSAEEQAHPNRRDWSFTFSAEDGFPLSEGEGRFSVRIAGSEIAGAEAFVHIPEEWERTWRDKQSRRQLATVLTGALLVLLALAVCILGVIRWARGGLDPVPQRNLTAVTGILLLITSVNEWPRNMGGFSTELSYGYQVGLTVFGLGLSLAFLAGAVGVLGSLAHSWLREEPGVTSSFRGPWQSLTLGLALGLGVTGGLRFMGQIGSEGPPPWPSYGEVVTYLPWLSGGLLPVVVFLTLTAAALLLLVASTRLWGTRWRWLVPPLVLLVGLALAPNDPAGSWMAWIGMGSAYSVGMAFGGFLCSRLGWATLPGIMATFVLLAQVEVVVLHPFPGSTLGGLLALPLVAAAAFLWTKGLERVAATAQS